MHELFHTDGQTYRHGEGKSRNFAYARKSSTYNWALYVAIVQHGNKFGLLYFATFLPRLLSGYRVYNSNPSIFRGRNSSCDTAEDYSRQIFVVFFPDKFHCRVNRRDYHVSSCCQGNITNYNLRPKTNSAALFSLILIYYLREYYYHVSSWDWRTDREMNLGQFESKE